MDEEFDLLKEYLPGLQPDMKPEFRELAKIFQYKVFEMSAYENKENPSDCYIPFMMNDAVECYFILKNCKIIGEILPEMKWETKGELVQKEDAYGLIVRQGNQNVYTIWFQDIELVKECYQYHQIGHYWRKGEEQWRQLVYMAGTIFDKSQYIGGNAVCNKIEEELQYLILFAPFRNWSPVNYNIKTEYPAAYEGIECMEALAKEAEDYAYLKKIHSYKKRPSERKEKKLSQMLLSPKREKLYQLIYQKMEKASEEYQQRKYDESLEREIREKREIVNKYLKEKGFEGSYPQYYTDIAWVQVTEEHPFTIFEEEDYKFDIHLMISRTKEKANRNSGFFKGKHRRSIVISFEDLLHIM